MNFSNFTTSDGLPGNAIWAIYKDNAGELWFVANGDSVCKFDGAKFSKVTFN